jgi:hypothetical protein
LDHKPSRDLLVHKEKPENQALDYQAQKVTRVKLVWECPVRRDQLVILGPMVILDQKDQRGILALGRKAYEECLELGWKAHLGKRDKLV